MGFEVDGEVSRRKFHAEVEAFHRASAVTTERGCHLMAATFPVIRLSMTKWVQIAGATVPLVLVAVEVDFTNFDLDPPSVRFVDAVAFQEDRDPPFPIIQIVDGQPRSLVPPGKHPLTGLPFLCHPGVREYHTHPEHSGEPWEVVREEGRFGGLVWLCDLLWSNCVQRLRGIQIQLPMVTELDIPGPA